ncbi:PKD domain-containing protein [Halorubrum salsamenti]|uniref:PKD domain-containing protein n=1 Tax=Halorubrum salsamenti TaxID=2583990 RepID=UPI0011A478BB|nr:PKD domain-containing protein [Halorubrum salsamenti]
MNDTRHGYFRKAITALLAVALVLSVFGPVGTVAAAPSVSVEQTADSTTVAPGETVTLTTQFDVEELNAPQLSATTPDGWEITEQTAEGAVSYNDGTWTWIAGDKDGINASYTVEYNVSVPEDASPADYTISVEGSALGPDDSAKTADSDSTTITVEVPDQNEDPSASFTASPSAPEAGETVSFDASGSSDADGSIASYEWDFGDGETATGATPTHTYDSPGDYDVTLTVTDDDGANDTATQTVSVSEVPNQEPTASISGPSSAQVGEQVSFDASGSSDADGFIESYEWDFDDGTTASAAKADHTYDSPGDYDVTLTVTDDDGANDTATQTVSVSEAPDPATFQVSNLNAPDNATQGDNISVSAEITNDGDEEATQTVAFRLDADGNGTLEGDETLASQNVTLDGGESQTVTFGDLDTSDLPVDTFTHGIVTEDDSATAEITINAPAPATFQVSNLNAPDNATQGEAIDVTADVTNDGDEEATQSVAFRLDADGNGTLEGDEALASQNVTLGADETQTVTFSDIDTSGLDAREYEHGVFTDDDSETAILSVEKAPLPPVDDFENSPADPDGDGFYEDINGDGQFDIVDVQALFANLDDGTVQNNPDAFDFNQDGGVDVVDVQKLYNEVLQ